MVAHQTWVRAPLIFSGIRHILLAQPYHHHLAIPLSRESHVVPDEAILQCRAGTLAFKANMSEKAAASFTRALTLNPLLWEAFEGLCAIGQSQANLLDF